MKYAADFLATLIQLVQNTFTVLIASDIAVLVFYDSLFSKIVSVMKAVVHYHYLLRGSLSLWWRNGQWEGEGDRRVANMRAKPTTYAKYLLRRPLVPVVL